jgi:hypothetical protein
MDRLPSHHQKQQDLTSLPLIIANDNDVLSGRGGLSNNHPGNRLFRRLIQHNRYFYQTSETPTQKQLLVYSIVAAMEGKGGRFLRMHDGRWVQASLNSVRRKTAQALRESDTPSSPASTMLTTHQARSYDGPANQHETFHEYTNHAERRTQSVANTTAKEAYQPVAATLDFPSPFLKVETQLSEDPAFLFDQQQPCGQLLHHELQAVESLATKLPAKGNKDDNSKDFTKVTSSDDTNISEDDQSSCNKEQDTGTCQPPPEMETELFPPELDSFLLDGDDSTGALHHRPKLT